MSTDETPYICECEFCEQGLLRFRSCPECEAICAVCEEIQDAELEDYIADESP